ncbi:MAG TPA: squalene synthase HpnC [Candidatus Eisenbacteria bacterium]|nr:squalene synthase HpnC [Candidatus Eisenbacteria bacterium]
MSDVAVAYAECERLARAHYENFPVGSWLLPRRLRRDLAAVYAFARRGDDLADEGTAPVAERLAALGALEEQLLACAADPAAATDPVFVALGHTIAAHALPVQPFRDLLTAFRRDAGAETRAFATFADVLEYCRCSANPVGRIVLGLFGHRDEERAARADDVCTALQLTNFWQDVRGDLEERGRVYIPGEDLDRFPGSREALATRRTTDGLRACLAFQVERTRELFARGLALAGLVEGRLRREVRLFAGGGMAILDRIEAGNYDVLAERPRLHRGDLARLVWKELWR